MAAARIIEIRRGVLEKNDQFAAGLRERFHAAGVYVINLVSSPGSGKTELLERTLSDLQPAWRVAAIVGDLATDNDAKRLARSGAPSYQIETDGNCHLEAHMIEQAVAGWRLEELDFLFIENVGNLVCPSGYDLGEDMRVVLMSTTEGEDKPRKYPTIFQTADLAMITKIDLAAAVEFDQPAALASIDAIRPGLPVLETSARRGQGISAWLDYLIDSRAAALAAGVLQDEAID